MYPTSDLFKMLMMRPDREFLCKVDVGGEEYGMGNIVDFLIETNLLANEGFEIGTVFRSLLTLRLKLKSNVPNNAKIVPYVSFDTSVMTWDQATVPWDEATMSWGGGAGDWMPLGEFYINKRQQINDVWEFECFCKLIFSERPFVTSLTYPASMQAVWDEICDQLGYTYDDTVVINPSYTVPFKPVGMTCNEVMGYIAGANSASVRTGKDGRIQFARYSATYTPVMEMTASDYIRVAHTNPIKEYTRFVVMYDDEQDLAYEAGSGTEDQTLHYYNPFMTQQMVDDLEATLGGFKYQPIEMDARGYPPLDAGDWIGYEVYEGLLWEEAISPWQDTHTPWNGMVHYGTVLFSIRLSYHGGFRMALDAPSKSPQQSEFVVEGQLTKQVKQINKTAVKLDRSYYGVTTSREDGLVIEREDGVSKVTFNSDVMDWVVNGSPLLYLDAQARKLMFAGTLEGVDGTFSGTVSAASIIGSTIQGGTINGTTISGTNIYGSYIATGLGTYPFVEFSSSAQLIRAYRNANQYVGIIASSSLFASPTIDLYDSGYLSQILQLGTELRLTSWSGGIRMTGASINAQGDFMVNNGISFDAFPMANSSATTVPELVANFNQLLGVLRSLNILA